MSEKDREIKGVEGGDPAAALRAVGVDPASIDFVVVSHLHYDHAGGMVDADGEPNFPKARYVVQRDESEAAHGDELRLAGIMEREQLDLVRAAGQLAEVAGRGGAGGGCERAADRRPHPRLAGGSARDAQRGPRRGPRRARPSSGAT